MKNNNEIDDYIHLKVNYWILTGLCGIFLGLFMLSWLKVWGSGYVIAYGSLFIICAFYALVLYIKKRDIELKFRNVQ